MASIYETKSKFCWFGDDVCIFEYTNDKNASKVKSQMSRQLSRFIQIGINNKSMQGVFPNICVMLKLLNLLPLSYKIKIRMSFCMKDISYLYNVSL